MKTPYPHEALVEGEVVADRVFPAIARRFVVGKMLHNPTVDVGKPHFLVGGAMYVHMLRMDVRNQTETFKGEIASHYLRIAMVMSVA